MIVKEKLVVREEGGEEGMRYQPMFLLFCDGWFSFGSRVAPVAYLFVVAPCQVVTHAIAVVSIGIDKLE